MASSWGQRTDVPQLETVYGSQMTTKIDKQSEDNFKSLFYMNIHKNNADLVTHCYTFFSYTLLHGYT